MSMKTPEDYDHGRDKRTVGNLQPIVLLQTKTGGRIYADKTRFCLEVHSKEEVETISERQQYQ